MGFLVCGLLPFKFGKKKERFLWIGVVMSLRANDFCPFPEKYFNQIGQTSLPLLFVFYTCGHEKQKRTTALRIGVEFLQTNSLL